MDEKIFYYLDRVEKLIEGKPEMPVTVEIDPSNRCQLNCDFCMFKNLRKSDLTVPGSVDKKDLAYDIFYHLLLDLKTIDVKSITFTGGGEPTLNKDYERMVNWAHELKFEFGLITNGLRLNKLRRLDRYKFIRISLDSASPETYAKVKKASAFNRVVSNIKEAVRNTEVVGISFVVTKQNKHEIEKAQALAKDLGVSYIQFKPAWEDGVPFTDYVVNGESQTISTERYKAIDTTPCAIAGLIGIVGADAHVYYCCQHRGNKKYGLGSLYHASFPSIWKRRPGIIPDVKRCPNCRYMNYTKAYKNLIENKTFMSDHRNFL